MTGIDRFTPLTIPKPGAKMTTRCPRKAAKVFKSLIASLPTPSDVKGVGR